MNKSKNIPSLQDLITVVQIEDITEKSEGRINKFNKDNLKYAVPAFVTLVLGIIISLITLNPIFAFCGLSCLGGIAILRMTRDDFDSNFNKEVKIQNKRKVLYLNSEQSSTKEPILEKNGTNIKNAKDFYSETCREILDKEFPLEIDQFEDYECPIGLLLSKNEVQAKIVHELEIYSQAYKIPPVTISPTEWDRFFDIIYDEFSKLPIQINFYIVMNYLLRYVLASTLVHNFEHIDIFDFIKAIKCLDSFIPSKKLIIITKKIKESLSPTSKKLIFFNPTAKKRN